MIAFWNETLENISQDKFREKFSFIINDTSYEIPLSFALGISPIVTKKYINDQTLTEFKLNLSDSKNQFKNIIKGKPVERDFLLEVGKLLGNQEMIQKWKKCEEISTENIIKRINFMTKDLNSNILNLEEEYNYIGKHFEELKDKISQLNIDELIKILKNPKLEIKGEESIWEIVRNKIEEYPEKKDELLSCVNLQYLDSNCLKEFIDKIESKDIILFWDNLKPNILKNLNDKKVEQKQFYYQENSPFDGIFNYLSGICEGNVHEKGLVKITASGSSSNFPHQVTNHNWNEFWVCDERPSNKNPWIQFDFLEKRKVELTGYSIKAHNGNFNFLINWIIEGSNDGSNWIEIDKQADDQYINGTSNQHYYAISTKSQPFQIIRLRMNGLASSSSNVLAFTEIELFGTLEDLSM